MIAAPDNADLRAVLGHFPSGVVVVAARGVDGPVGMTCQSFASLSLNPPLVTFAVARTSKTWPLIHAIGTFGVSVLSEDQQQHSAAFSRSGTDKFAGVDWSCSPAGAPVIGGACAWVDCTVYAVYDGGDHEIVVGHVTSLGAVGRRAPLVFHRGAYGIQRTVAAVQ